MIVATSSPVPAVDKSGGKCIISSGFRTPHRPEHHGCDVGTSDGIEIGTLLYAVEDGEVIRVGQDMGVGAGINIWLLGNSGYGWKYFHMQRYIVHVGQKVKRGDIVGFVGNSGTGAAHLHLQKHNVRGSRTSINWGNHTAVDPTQDILNAWANGWFPPFADSSKPPEKDWFDMATPEDLRNAVRDVLKEKEIQRGIAHEVLYWLCQAKPEGQKDSDPQIPDWFDEAFVLSDLQVQIANPPAGPGNPHGNSPEGTLRRAVDDTLTEVRNL